MKNGCATGKCAQVWRCNKLQKDCFVPMNGKKRRPAARMLHKVCRLYLTWLMKYILITPCMFAAKGKNYIIVNFSSINIFFLFRFTYLSTSALIDLAATGELCQKIFDYSSVSRLHEASAVSQRLLSTRWQKIARQRSILIAPNGSHIELGP